ncbi:alpha/beta fold hydrolase [Sagittula sp. S175]|uniref:alpha/beta fold hydrolase n=1 Tax=Sagittula sp. S175 TaxID=3415129 RepID=UPI003C7D9E82
MSDVIQVASPCAWEVDGLTYRGLAWGPRDGRPVLALHGWMDHADSFGVIAPLLTGCHVVALDLSGQGMSDHRVAHASYNLWDDLPQIASILELLGWDRCVMMGHSRGANIATLFAAAQPDRVNALVALDSLVPEPSDLTIVETLSAFVTQTKRQMARPPRSFASREEYLERRAAQGNATAVSERLADRALMETSDGFILRGDPRLFASSAVKLDQKDVEDVLAALSCPVLNVWARHGIKSTRAKILATARLAEERVADYRSLDIDGDHHFHMAPDAAAHIADTILEFLGHNSTA